ncbi:MAG: SusC/RagA family TonB-linked outer membrane protein, partial [Cytophagales bacterium]|nr:SusC/RagA family TonB-linked outer membrane protein [Cytophagales bacterium]
MKNKLLAKIAMAAGYIFIGVFLQCLFWGLLLASNSDAQKIQNIREVYIQLNLESAKLSDIFEEVEAQTDFEFSYFPEDVNTEKQIRILNDKQSVRDLLLCVSKEAALFFRQVNNNISVKTLSRKQAKNIQEIEVLIDGITVTGKVISSEDNEGLPGVNVVIKGTTTGTVTDIEGNYRIDVPDAETILVFSSVGFVTEEMPVGMKTIIDVSLTPDLKALEEIVVVGFGTQKEESVVGSILSVKPAELKIPSSNLTGALAGKVAGVISYQRSGEPGADNAQFFVRGITTFADGAVPLILIDGVELTVDDLARLNPDDIESFSVLKDATATAVFGARGANGIIYVTTKEGETGKARLSIRFENSFSENTSLPEFADTVTYMRLANEAVDTRTPGARVPFSEEKIFNTANGRNANVFPAVDWQNELLKRFAISQRFNFNVKGGGEVAQYYVAGGFTHDSGILKEDTRTGADNNVNLERYLLRSNVSINPSSSTRAIVRLHATLDNLTGPAIPGNGSPGTNAFTRTLNASPVRFPAIYDADSASANARNILFGNSVADIGNNMYINPYAELVSGFSRSSNSFSLIQIDLHQDLSALVEGLKFRFRGNSNRNSSFNNSRSSTPFWYNASLINYNRVTDEYTLLPLNPDGGDESLGFNPGGSAVSNVLYAEFAFNYDRTFA